MADHPTGPALVSGLSDDDVLAQAWQDWIAARDARYMIEERKRQAYRDYRGWRSDIAGGGKSETTTGPFGWSQTTVPIIYWTIETILPRLGTQAPTVIAKPSTPAAVEYAHAKSMRIQHDLKMSQADTQIQLALRTGMVMGDGVMKIPFDVSTGSPTILALDWWDTFISPEATNWKNAEVIFHRSWQSSRDLERLAARKDEKGRPLYDADAIDQLRAMLSDRSAYDTSWAERREISGIGTTQFTQATATVPVLELWYREGARVVIAGNSRPVLLSVQKDDDYIWKDPKGNPFRPFAVFTPTPDLFSPYGISVAEMLAGHQHELSTLRNQYVDQLSASIFAPLGFDARKVRGEDVMQAWSAPGGMFATEGPPSDAVARFQPGSLTRDFSTVYDQIRSEAQLIGGTSDYGAGMTQAAGVSNQTATGISMIVSEGNKRYESLRHQHELAMQEVACHFDYIDRLLGAFTKYVPLSPGYAPPPDASGMELTGNLAEIGAEVNTPDKLYDVMIDVGAMAPPQDQEQAKNVTALVQSLAMLPPPVQQGVNWDQLLRMLMQSLGQNPDTLITPPPPPGMGMPVGPPQPLAGQGGEVPIGPPQPIG